MISVFTTGTFAACSGGSSGSRSPGINAAGSTSGTGSPDGGAASTSSGSAFWPDLPIAEIALTGGAASSGGGIAQAGGTARFISSGGIALGSSLPAPQPPALPPAAAGAMSVSGSALAADITAPAGLVVPEMVQSSGTDTIRHITAGGDVVISGTLRAADLGTSRQGLDIEAAGHTVYISGTVDSSGAKGQAGGPVTIVADQVVVTGKVSTAGGAGAQPGTAGAVTIKTTSAVWLAGALDASGGDASGGDGMTGGRGGDLTISAGGDIALAGTLRVRGGAGASSAGNAQGGAAGAVEYRLFRRADVAGRAGCARRRGDGQGSRRSRRGGRGRDPHRRRDDAAEGDQRGCSGRDHRRARKRGRRRRRQCRAGREGRRPGDLQRLGRERRRLAG